MSLSPRNLPGDVYSDNNYGLLLTGQIIDTAGTTEAPAELQAVGGKAGRLTKPVSAELVICRRRLGSD